MTNRLKIAPEAENEIQHARGFADYGHCVITPVIQLAPLVAGAVTSALSEVVTAAHRSPGSDDRSCDGIVRAQVFEEGSVYMLAPPNDRFGADRYIMDFYDVRDQGSCSRMHLHTGMRYVRIMTGPDTRVRISTLSKPEILPGVSTGFVLSVDSRQISLAEDDETTCFDVWVPPCVWVDMQVPRGTAHQFNATGPNAVIDTIHPEETLEVLREDMRGISMMAQTIFLEHEHPHVDACVFQDESPTP